MDVSWVQKVGSFQLVLLTVFIIPRSEQRRNCFLRPKDPQIYGRPFNVCQRNRHCLKILLYMCVRIDFGVNQKKKKIRGKLQLLLATLKFQSNWMKNREWIDIFFNFWTVIDRIQSHQVFSVIVGKINVFTIKPCTISQGNYFLADIFDVFELSVLHTKRISFYSKLSILTLLPPKK